MTEIQLPSERHFRLHRRQWLLYLLGCTAMGVGTIVAVLTPGENPEYVLVPSVTLFSLMFALGFLEQARRRTEFKREMKRIQQDEWTQRGLRRSVSLALRTVIFGQVPLVFFMAYVPPEPSVIGMGLMTVALGCGVMAASYLYYTRASSDE
jgi:hypothetical protein